MNAYQVIVRPLVTEKNTMLIEQGKYCFEIDRRASKPQVKAAIEEIFKVSVTDVATINVRGKMKRRGKDSGYTANWKKAIVTLAAGDRIELFEGV